MAQLLYTEWFVKFKFTGHEKIKMVDSGTEYGMIPEGWEVKSFTDIAEIQSGGTPKTEVVEYWNGSIPFFTPKDAVESGYVFDTGKKITEYGLKKCNSNLYEKDTVFITARGTVGKVCIAARSMAMNQSCYALVGKDGFPQFFIFQQIMTAIENLKHRAHGAVFATIIVDTFDKLLVVKPSKDIAIKYSLVVEPLFREMHNVRERNLVLSRIRDLLIPQLITGKRPVK
jgi:type I restriction enzyme, S subunit